MACSKYEFGYDDSRFEIVVSQRFHCSICLLVLKDPVMCKNQHYYCSSCIKKHLENSLSCPTCLEHLAFDTLNEAPRIVKDYISELNIHCDFHPRGCLEMVQVGDLERHVVSCGFSPVQCSNEGCSVVLNSKDKIHHESEVCGYRKVKFHDCGQHKNEVKRIKEEMLARQDRIRNEIQDEIKNEMQRIKDEIKAEVKGEIKQVMNEMKAMKNELKQETKAIKSGMKGVKDEMQKMKQETKTEGGMKELINEMKAMRNDFRQETKGIKDGMKKMKDELQKIKEEIKVEVNGEMNTMRVQVVSQMEEMKEEIKAEVKREIKEVKNDMKVMKNEIKQETKVIKSKMKGVEDGMKNKMSEVKSEIKETKDGIEGMKEEIKVEKKGTLDQGTQGTQVVNDHEELTDELNQESGDEIQVVCDEVVWT